MNLTVHIPDEMAPRLAAGGDLERRALEALLLEALRAGRITKAELRQALGFAALNELDGFLKAHGVFEEYTLADLERDRQTLDRLGV
uniref:Uncharacterized protein n=1 Tax=Acidicaldus sp. TaxID=1872105 RepID=A0A8J4M6E1_9PROT